MPKSKFFRVAVEGATTDGRTIERQSLIEMAASYNPATYQARVNMEHIRGFSAEPPFNAYGDVLALKTETIALDIGGKAENRLALFAEIEALDPLIQMNQRGQKLFTSIEINPNFAGTGKAYLMGLAVTDSPASLGTEMLKFCAGLGDKSPLAARKQGANHEFSEALESDFALADTVQADPQGFTTAFKSFMDKLTGAIPAPAAAPAAPAAPAVPAATTAAAPDANFTALTALVGQLGTTLDSFTRVQAEENRKLREDLSNLSNTVASTAAPQGQQRPLSTGTGNNFAQTDC